MTTFREGAESQPEARGETPRTDAALASVMDGDCLPKCDSYGHEDKCPRVHGEELMADFARQLERERNLLELRWKMQCDDNERLERELAAAKRVAMPRDDEIRLAMGELTADQMRTAKAAIRWVLSRQRTERGET